MTESIDRALALWDSGLVPIPLKPRSKAASIHWEQWQRRRPDRELVSRWFAYHAGNIGVMTGAVSGGLAVLDFDDLAAFDAWRAGWGVRSLTVATGRGVHVYLRVDALPGATFAMPGCDVKVTGYVVGPGSVHPTGARYMDNGAPVVRIGALADVGIIPPLVEKTPRDVQQAPTHPHTRNMPASAIKTAFPILDFLARYTDTTRARNGRFAVVRCPWPGHEDIHPSFQIDRLTNNATCMKPSCPLHDRRGLDILDLYHALEGASFPEAIRALSAEVTP